MSKKHALVCGNCRHSGNKNIEVVEIKDGFRTKLKRTREYNTCSITGNEVREFDAADDCEHFEVWPYI